MSLHPQSRSSLLRLLMILEWILLGIVVIAQILLAIVNYAPLLMVFNGIGIVLFAALRIRTPRRWTAQLLYTGAEFGLIFSMVFVGNIPLPPMLFIVLVIRNCIFLEGHSRSIATGLAFVGCLIAQTYRLLDQSLLLKVPLNQLGTVWVGFFLVFGLVMLFLHLLVDAALKERQGQEQLEAVNARLRQYALRVEELATVQERNRIARDLHDSLGHSLTVFSIHLEAALKLLHSNPAKAELLLKDIKQLNAKTLQEVRQSLSSLRADPLEGRSLSKAIAELVEDFQRSTDLSPECVIQVETPLSKELNTAIYRIAQESLTNICKYASATNVQISIVQSAKGVQVTIQDDGQGFERDQNTTGYGLQGMQERALALAGQLKIVTAPSQGCCIHAVFPV